MKSPRLVSELFIKNQLCSLFRSKAHLSGRKKEANKTRLDAKLTESRTWQDPIPPTNPKHWSDLLLQAWFSFVAVELRVCLWVTETSRAFYWRTECKVCKTKDNLGSSDHYNNELIGKIYIVTKCEDAQNVPCWERLVTMAVPMWFLCFSPFSLSSPYLSTSASLVSHFLLLTSAPLLLQFLTFLPLLQYLFLSCPSLSLSYPLVEAFLLVICAVQASLENTIRHTIQLLPLLHGDKYV